MVYFFPYFLQFKSEFCNKKFMIWATVSSWSFFCWLYIASLSLTAKNIIIWFQYWPSLMTMCRLFSCVVGRGCLLWLLCSLGKTLLAFDLLHFVLQGQICLLLYISLYFLLFIPVPYDEKDMLLLFECWDTWLGPLNWLMAKLICEKTNLHSLKGKIRSYSKINHLDRCSSGL